MGANSAKQGQSHNKSDYQESLRASAATVADDPILNPRRSTSISNSNSNSSAKDLVQDTRSRHGSGDSSSSTSNMKNMGTLLIVHQPSSDLPANNISQHPVLQQLNTIPNFSPILHQRTIKSSNYSWINEKSIATNNQQFVHHALEISPYLNIGHLFQSFVQDNAHAISVRQSKLTKCIKETDKKLIQLMKNFGERQRNFAKYADKLSKVQECTNSLVKCQNTIQNCKRTIKALNELLPPEERLEPFVWGEDVIELVDMYH